MKLNSLLLSLDHPKVYGGTDITISSITDDSRKVKKGSLFIAVEGLKVDRHQFINQAIKKGAVGVIGTKGIDTLEIPNGVTYVEVKDTRKALALVSAAWFHKPSSQMTIIGVTGTDGKTTTASLIYHLLKTAGRKVGLISSVGAEINGKLIDTGFHVTSPDPYPLQSFLAKMYRAGCKFVVLEVTSHGIDQKRVEGVDFDVSVLTNITPEHLDYHKSFEDYRETKVGFLLKAKTIIANQDDISFIYLKKKVTNQRLISYSVNQLGSDYKAEGINDCDGLQFEVLAKGRQEHYSTKLVGVYNVSNGLAAIATTELLGVKSNYIQKGFSSFELPEGRMQKILLGQPYQIYVDFAHTPNALRQVLTSLRPKVPGKLICVFGCAGERDFTKRPVMGKIAGEIADVSVFTAEDPRTEKLLGILEKMKEGALASQSHLKTSDYFKTKDYRLSKHHFFTDVPERHEAIAFALSIACPKDAVIICGKGHEKSLAYLGFEHPWSDQEMIRKIVKGKPNLTAIVLAAGKGKRMQSKLPKVLHEIAGRPMISYTLENLRRTGILDVVVVVGYKKDEVIKEIKGAVRIAFQSIPLGTAHAVSKGLLLVPDDCQNLIVLNGDDSAFYSAETINDVIKMHLEEKAVLTFVSLVKDDPIGLGRVVRDKNGTLSAIVEEKDATPLQKKIKEVNDGLYVFDKLWLGRNLSKVKKSQAGEYYLVDLVKIALSQNQKVAVFKLKNDEEWQGINTPEQLIKADIKMQRKLAL